MLHALVARALLVPLRREVVLLLLERTLAPLQVEREKAELLARARNY